MQKMQTLLESVGNTLVGLICVIILSWFVSLIAVMIFGDSHKYLLMITQVILYISAVVVYLKSRKKIKSEYKKIKTIVVEKI